MTEYKFVVQEHSSSGGGIPVCNFFDKLACSLVVVDYYMPLKMPSEAHTGRVVHRQNLCTGIESNPMHAREGKLVPVPSQLLSAACPQYAMPKLLATTECVSQPGPQADAVFSVSLSEEDCDLDFVHEGGGRYSTITEPDCRTCGLEPERALVCAGKRVSSCLRCELYTNIRSQEEGLRIFVELAGAAETHRRMRWARVEMDGGLEEEAKSRTATFMKILENILVLEM